MRDLFILAAHLLTSIATLLGPGGARDVVADSLLMEQQLLIINRYRHRGPRLTAMVRANIRGRFAWPNCRSRLRENHARDGSRWHRWIHSLQIGSINNADNCASTASINSMKNPNADEITVSRGIPSDQREHTAQFYDIAFGEKLALAIRNANDRIQLLSKSMLLDYAIGAFHGTKLIGIAWFSSSQGALTGGIDYRGLLSELGWMNGNRAPIVFSLYERTAQVGELLMDGIVVDPEYRGKGVGTQLFSGLMKFDTSEQ